jgi:hypothetical protein
MIFHSPLLNILINLISVGKYNFFNWGTFVPQGTVYGVFLMGTVPGLNCAGLTSPKLPSSVYTIIIQI